MTGVQTCALPIYTAADFVILAPVGLQEHAHSEEICYTSSATFSDEELINMIRYAKSKRIRVALKPTVSCKNGVWRAYISFFEKDVPCEPKWENWFASYTEFQTHYAKIAEAEQCDLFIAGCEMVMTEHRSEEWRNVIAAIRNYYHGPVSYNTDKYQEENVTWWDCVDMISSSGYYPPDRWEQELDRIETLVQSLLKITKLDAGSVILEKATENVADMLRDVELHFAYRAKQEHKELVLSGPEEVLLFCDRDWLTEAIDNIVKNALDHTESGDAVHITWKALPNAVQIAVKDNGCGIHPEDLHHIFKRFYRSRFSQDKQGIGLGLPLAKTIVEAHSGTIEVDSELGKGTTFTMNFLIPTKL